jgi:parallel beta-helix repeat protein
MAEAAPSTIYVSKPPGCSNSGPGTVSSPYCTVQEGVNAAASGDTVLVEKGTYTEQVLISSGKNSLTVTGAGSKTIIKAPATMTSPKAIVQISTATGVTLSNLTISGPGGGGCDSLEYGVRIDTAGQANITDDHITKIEDSPFSGCQNGVAIQVGRAADSTTGSATITNTTIDNYQKNGITVSNTGSSAKISDNNVTGVGPTAIIAQNGIEIATGATATINDNTVKNNIYSPKSVSSTGILLINSGVVSLNDNVANHNDTDIYSQGVLNSTFMDNVANNGTFNGIYLDPTSNGNTLTDNSAHGTSKGAGNYDMEDDSSGIKTLGTANTWHDNGCKTSLPAKLCKQ